MTFLAKTSIKLLLTKDAISKVVSSTKNTKQAQRTLRI